MGLFWFRKRVAKESEPNSLALVPVQAQAANMDMVHLPKANLTIWNSADLMTVFKNKAANGKCPLATPDIIKIGSLRPKLDSLIGARSSAKGKFLGQGLFMDSANNKMLVGPVAMADKGYAVCTVTPYGATEDKIRKVCEIRVRAESLGESLSLLEQEMIDFLGDDKVVAIFVGNIRRTALIVKTSSTREKLDQAYVASHVGTILRDFAKRNTNQNEIFDSFTRETCLEFGMSLFLSHELDEEVLQKVNVCLLNH